jgi:hypothetical protein
MSRTDAQAKRFDIAVVGGGCAGPRTRGDAFASLISMPVLAQASVAFYLGMQTLSHVDGDEDRIEQTFSQAYTGS